MTTRRYSEAALRALIESFDSPMLVIHEGRMRCVNEAFVRLMRRERAQVEGRPFLEFVAPEERSRLSGRYRQRLEEGRSQPRRYLISSALGTVHEVVAQSQQVELEGEGLVLLVNCVMLQERPVELILSERLVETSAELVAARSEEAVRRVALTGLTRVGYAARFLRREGESLVAHDEGVPPADASLGLESLVDGRPVFAGASANESTHVYLPLGAASSELLWVSGAGLSHYLGSVLALFAKVVGAALTDARLLADVERGRWEMVSVAEMARFVAQPDPPTLEQFLARVASLLDAEAAVLYAPVSPEGELVLADQVGLDELSRAGLAGGRCRLRELAATTEGPVLAGEAEAHALRAASQGRFGCGAAVRLAHGGQVRGVLQVLRSPARPFGGGDLRLLGILSELLVTLLEQRRLRAESARQLTDTRLLLDLARTTTATLETATVLDIAADFLVKLLNVSNCFILLYDEQARALRGAAASATHRDAFRNVEIPLESRGVIASVARERRPIAIADVENTTVPYEAELVRRFNQRALLALPLTSREELIGVVMMDDTRGPRSFDAAVIELAEATCGQIALAIANARLYESLWASYAELAAARAEMVKRERLAALGELSAIVAHEVRNPLGVIFNAVASLRRMLQPQGDTAMLLDILGEESDRLNRMVGDLLDYTRPRELILQPEDCALVLQDALESARALHGVSERHLTLSTEVEPELPRVPMDRRLIRQALVNVAVNAIQSMPHGGVLQVRARREEQGGREVLRIDLADQGPGIPPELLHRIFEPFFTTKAQGTGLGLAVVKRIVEEHQGEVSVESALGHGTTFTFRLPFTQSASPP